MLNRIYLTSLTFYLLGLATLLFMFGLLSEVFYRLGLGVLATVTILIIRDFFLLFVVKSPLIFSRTVPQKLSNGDPNLISVEFSNTGSLPLRVKLIENLPYQLQMFNFEENYRLVPGETLKTGYSITPALRGEYTWGPAVLLIRPEYGGLLARKEEFHREETAACYPSFLRFTETRLNARAENTSQNDIRKIGQSLEFEQIKEYAPGDDHRHMNWKATARRGQLMLNRYRDERSQDIYCAIDMGRTMKMPFHNRTLLDYAINAALALTRTVIATHDKAGILAFAHRQSEFLPPAKDWRQFGRINEFLYKLETGFLESDFEHLYKFIRAGIRRRSLIILFTNFDSENALKRNFRYLKDIARHHLLVVVFFEDSEAKELVETEARDITAIYERAVNADKLYKGRLLARELQKAGIRTVLTPPEKLGVQIINEYIGIKKQQIL